MDLTSLHNTDPDVMWLLLALMLTIPNARAQDLPASTPNLALPLEIRHFLYDRTDHALYRAFQVTGL